MDVDNRNVYGRSYEVAFCTITHYVRSTAEFGRYFDSFNSRIIVDVDVTGYNNRIEIRTEWGWYFTFCLFGRNITLSRASTRFNPIRFEPRGVCWTDVTWFGWYVICKVTTTSLDFKSSSFCTFSDRIFNALKYALFRTVSVTSCGGELYWFVSNCYVADDNNNWRSKGFVACLSVQFVYLNALNSTH